MAIRSVRRLVWLTFLLLVALWSAGGLKAVAQEAPLHPELRFAQELAARGYQPLAVDQLIRTRERAFLPAEVRMEASKMLARVYRTMGQQAEASRSFEEKHDYFKKAIAQYGRYLEEGKGKIGEEDRCTVLYENGALCAGLARDAATSMEGTADEQERKDYKKSATEWFSKAVADLEVSGKFFAQLRDSLFQSAQTREDKIRLRDVREKAGEVLFEWGKALYESSQVYDTKEEAAARTDRLKAAIAIFEGIAEHYSLFDLRYKAYRYIGLCYRGMGQYDKAVEFLQKAADLQRIPDTVWIIRLARYNLAQTYNDWGKYDRGDTSADALISEVYPEMAARGDEDPDLIDVYFAAWLEKGRALTANAKDLMKKATEAEKANQAFLAQERRRQAQRDYRMAVDKAKEISGHPTSRWARNAKMFLDRWIEESVAVFGEKIRVAPDINTYMSEGWRLFKDGKYLECIPSYQQAVLVGNPAIYGRTLIPEAWYQIGIAYYNLSMPEHTGGKYNYYQEAALCFSHIVEQYPKSAMASDAAYYAQQLNGALFEQTRQLVNKAALSRDALTYDGRRYYRTLQIFSVQFPGDARASGTLFQSAELARTLEQYEEGSAIYATIMQEHPRYYEAKYRAGLCLYLQALKLYDQSPAAALDQVGRLLEGAIARYQEYIDWFVNNKDRLGAEQFDEASKWVLQSKVAYGKLLVHDVWAKSHSEQEGAQRALQVLANVEKEHFREGASAELKEKYLPEAFFVVIQAYRRLDQLSAADRFVDDLAVRFGKHELSARAARFLGYAYLQRRKQLEELKGPEEDIRLAARSAGRYLQKALELEPEQSLAVYNDTASQLYVMQEYQEAVRILQAGVERFPLKEGQAPTKDQLIALGGLEDAYVALEDWPQVARYAGQLLEIEKKENQERVRKGEPELRDVNRWRDYALAMEKLNKPDDAIRYWREVKTVADKMEGEAGRQTKFEATLHLARSYAKKGDAAHGYTVAAWYLLSSADWLRSTEWARSVEELYNEFFRDKYAELGEHVMQHITGDVRLLREEASKNIVVGLFDRHWPNRKAELANLIKKATVELSTGE